jgi:adenine-specific DNA-methyltransferase
MIYDIIPNMNISKQKRETLVAKANEIKAFIKNAPQDENTARLLSFVAELEKEIKSKKYGLVFEEHKEQIDEMLETNEPILIEDKSRFTDNGGQMNFLIEGDNLASLKLLEKTHNGRIDIIYIDPPYNTGAKDWKYDNDYADKNDLFRHSKWLTLMQRRLDIAKKLLTQKGVLICAIDENELHTLGFLLESIFGSAYEYHCISIVHNPRGIQGKNFSYTHEYAIFVVPVGDKIIGERKIDDSEIDWRNLRDNGGESLRTDAKNCFYPILVAQDEIIGFGEVVSDMNKHPKQNEVIDGVTYVYPIDIQGIERKWRYARQSVDSVKENLRVKIVKGRYEIEIGKNFGTYRTVWQGPRYDSNEYGKKIINDLVPDAPFDFPKSLWNVYDCLYAVVGKRKQAIILDFFAGSGTTGHAVLELNREDGGRRKFILCTNNENNICEEVTYQRIKTVITGKRKDGSEYSKGIAGSLKYFKVDFTPITEKLYYEYADTLLLHIKELVELENAIDFDHNDRIDILLDENQVEAFFTNEKKLAKVKTIYLGHDISLTLLQQQMATEHGIKINVIPEYYYKEKQI